MSAKHELTFLAPILITATRKLTTEHRRLLMFKIRHALFIGSLRTFYKLKGSLLVMVPSVLVMFKPALHLAELNSDVTRRL